MQRLELTWKRVVSSTGTEHHKQHIMATAVMMCELIEQRDIIWFERHKRMIIRAIRILEVRYNE